MDIVCLCLLFLLQLQCRLSVFLVLHSFALHTVAVCHSSRSSTFWYALLLIQFVRNNSVVLHLCYKVLFKIMSTSKFANCLNIVLPWMHISRNSIDFFCNLVSNKVDLKNNVIFLAALQLNYIKSGWSISRFWFSGILKYFKDICHLSTESSKGTVIFGHIGGANWVFQLVFLAGKTVFLIWYRIKGKVQTNSSTYYMSFYVC